MKTCIISVLSLLGLISCGKQSGSEPIKESLQEVPAPTTNKVIPESISHGIYIIGGQSNAAFLLNLINGYYDYSNSGQAASVFKSVVNTVGYSVGGTVVEYWLQQSNNQQLVNIIYENCSKNPYLIWWQGESDSAEKWVPTFTKSTDTLFTYLKSYCATLEIIEVVMPNIENNYYRDQIQLQQKQLGDFRFEAFGFEMADAVHFTSKGYTDVWTNLTNTFPLKSK